VLADPLGIDPSNIAVVSSRGSPDKAMPSTATMPKRSSGHFPAKTPETAAALRSGAPTAPDRSASEGGSPWFSRPAGPSQKR